MRVYARIRFLVLTSDYLKIYAEHVTRLAGNSSTAEETYYTPIVALLSAILKAQKLPDDVRVNTKERRAKGGVDRPDVALYDASGDFALVCIEAKTPKDEIEEIALGTGQNDQVGRYLAQTHAVIVTNVRSFALVTAPDWKGEGAVPPEVRRIAATIELWPSTNALKSGSTPPADVLASLTDLLEEAVTAFAPLADPESLARVLARGARRAKAAMPADFTDAVSGLQNDFGEALGITFEGEEGEEFFRSSLVQTLFYGVFAGWTLWWKGDRSRPFDWREVPDYLRIPFLGELFYEINAPARLKELRIRPFLDAATATLGRVDTERFFARMTPPTLGGNAEGMAASAITYFYEPFLEAFDPELRKQLGVWYTPPEIVRYQVRKVDALLRNELGMDLGLADPRVVVLDPCCGTGAYLVETLQTIANTLREEGAGEEIAESLKYALTRRVIGFEILTAPFVIAHLQLYLLLDSMGAAPGDGERLAVYLTNALTGWDSGTDQMKLNFPELQAEREAARGVKQKAEVIVVIGNPPYNRFAGAALEDEADLVDHYKGIKRDENGKPVGKSRLFTEWNVRKQLLDDLYIRFFRLAERRIGERAKFGLVCFISNSSFLNGRSHPLMRESLLRSFSEIWIDNLNGDKYKTGKTIPKELPGAGSSDQSVFTTDADPRGIQVGTDITTLLKRKERTTDLRVHYRDLWGLADTKRKALLNGTAGVYDTFTPTKAQRFKFVPYESFGGYEEWPALDELFPEQSMGLNSNRGQEDSIIDLDRESLAIRMREYFSDMPWNDFARLNPELTLKRARYEPEAVRLKLQKLTKFREERIIEYVPLPLDSRWIYYEEEAKLISERSPKLWENLHQNEFLVVVPQSRRSSETRPLLATSLFGLHLQDRGSVGFLLSAKPEKAKGDLFEELANPVSAANLTPEAWVALQEAYGLKGDLTGQGAQNLVQSLFRAALGLGHAPKFESDHRESLAQDWMHLPLPKDKGLLAELAEAGGLVATLLDPLQTARPALRAVLGGAYAGLAVVTRAPKAAGALDTAVTYSYFGGGKGRWEAREGVAEWPVWEGAPQDADHPWGDVAGDLYLNTSTYLANVPERVWKYELGGYPVVKKWLGYRQAKRRDGKALTSPELDHLRGIVHRLAALLALHPRLDALYERTIENAFTAEELGLRSQSA